jgi:single-stranded-DNA-specific exonuclease
VDIVTELRKERGIIDDPTAKLFDPFLFPEMTKAVTRIHEAIAEKEIVGIFGDYDADGVTATAQMVRYFRRHGLEPVVYLPDRMKDGYGMKKHSIDLLKTKDVTLIITVDTGITAHTEIAHAATLGIDVIVTDHHRPQKGRPPACAVIHPTLPTTCPNPHLAGAGVAFMLVRALEDGKPWQGIEHDIALASIGTIGDLVPLTGENRTLVIHGLKFLDNLPPSPLKNFIDEVRGQGSLTAGDIAFKVVPRINAAGRMAHPEIALKALLEGGEALAELHRLNGDRRTFVDDLSELLGDAPNADDLFIVVASEQVTPGTAGLLASRFTEKFGKPSLVAAIMGETAVASIRSTESIDVMDCVSDASVSTLLTTFGGHAQAAGCTLQAENIPKLHAALNAVLRKSGITLEDLRPSLVLDAVITPVALGLGFLKQLTTLQPFGSGNEEPRFLLSSQTLTDLRTVGADKSHLQCRVGHTKAIGFGLGALISKISSQKSFDIACRLGVNTWNGRESVQIFIEDVRVSLYTGTSPPST